MAWSAVSTKASLLPLSHIRFLPARLASGPWTAASRSGQPALNSLRQRPSSGLAMAGLIDLTNLSEEDLLAELERRRKRPRPTGLAALQQQERPSRDSDVVLAARAPRGPAAQAAQQEEGGPAAQPPTAGGQVRLALCHRSQAVPAPALATASCCPLPTYNAFPLALPICRPRPRLPGSPRRTPATPAPCTPLCSSPLLPTRCTAHAGEAPVYCLCP